MVVTTVTNVSFDVGIQHVVGEWFAGPGRAYRCIREGFLLHVPRFEVAARVEVRDCELGLRLFRPGEEMTKTSFFSLMILRISVAGIVSFIHESFCRAYKRWILLLICGAGQRPDVLDPWILVDWSQFQHTTTV